MKKLLAAVAVGAFLVGGLFQQIQVRAASMPLQTGTIAPFCQEASQLLACINALITQLNGSVTQNSLGASTAWRNMLDNGAMLVNQRGNGTAVSATCATTAGLAITSYSMDRWGCDVNVGSGVGTMTMTTSTPTPPPGFTNQAALNRASGVFTQPLCAWQEIKSTEVIPVQGQTVIFSGFLAAMAGLAADNGNVANLVIISGTTADQGMGVLRSAVGMTASPAITPVWTGLATLVNTPITLTTAYARYSTSAQVPIGAKELAVGVCFTPTATGAGATDGIVFTGMQLERADPGNTTLTPGPYEQRNFAAEILKCQHEFYAYPEPAANVLTPIVGTAVSASNWSMTMQFPVAMDVAPTFQEYGTALGVTTFKGVGGGVTNALATTFMVTNTANTPQNASLTVTGAGMTAGFAVVLIGNNAGAIPSWSADF